MRSGGRAQGVEPALIRSFAEAINSEVEWFWDSSSANLEALEKYELDIVLAALTKDDPRKKLAAFSRPYYTENLVVGFPEKTAAPDSLEGVAVHVREGSRLAGVLQSEDAVVVRAAHPFAEGRVVAAPEWELIAGGLSLSPHVLEKREHVVALPRGENRFVMAVESFLSQRSQEVESLLLREFRP